MLLGRCGRPRAFEAPSGVRGEDGMLKILAGYMLLSVLSHAGMLILMMRAPVLEEAFVG